MNKHEKIYPTQGYSDKELITQVGDYANQVVGDPNKKTEILMQHFAKANVGVAELQRRYTKRALYIAFFALLLSVASIILSLFDKFF